MTKISVYFSNLNLKAEDMDKSIVVACCLMIIAVVIVLIYFYKKMSAGKPGKTEEPSAGQGLIQTIKVPMRRQYQEDPDEESECGDTFPLEDADGLFDPDRPKKERQALAEQLMGQGFKVKQS